MGDEFFLNIEVSSYCNLRCPSCPVGNWMGEKNPTGFMPQVLLDKILTKATAECTITGIGFFNWGEPLLHPQLPSLVDVAHTYGVPAHLSSNLNLMKNIEKVLVSNPQSIRISVSGFTQYAYGLTHRGGQIEQVKKNMDILAAIKQRLQANTHIYVLFHLYADNLYEAVEMKRFATKLGFDFWPVWAHMMPLEKTIAYVNKQEKSELITETDMKIINKLALTIPQALEAARKYSNTVCKLREKEITIDIQGNVQLCCALYDANKFTVASFFDTPLKDLQTIKRQHPFCRSCMEHGLHVYYMYGAPEFNTIGMQNIATYNALGMDDIINNVRVIEEVFGVNIQLKNESPNILAAQLPTQNTPGSLTNYNV